jgi:hypothetical protein
MGGTPVQGFTGFSGADILEGVGGLLSLPAPAPGTVGEGIFSEIGERVRGAVSGCPTMFAATPATVRPLGTLEAVNPATGKMHYWKHMGRPILFSGDLAHCRRVGKVHARLNRARPRKR